MNTLRSTKRFSDRVADYVRYRPDYSAAMLDWLQRKQGVTPAWKVADVGAGTGISSKLFLDAGHAVTAVEPNAAMRAAATAWLGDRPGFPAIEGAANATALPDASVELVTVAQAFHWFEPASTRRELFNRCQQDGHISFDYDTRVIVGTL